MDYEEMLLQITDILKAHNRHHMNAPDHKQTIEQIRDVISLKAEWNEVIGKDFRNDDPPKRWLMCTNCGWGYNSFSKYCPNCGYKMKMRRSTDV